MFTGIIEELGEVTNLVSEKENLHITVHSNISSELKTIDTNFNKKITN